LMEMDTESLMEAIKIDYEAGCYLHPKVTSNLVAEYRKLVADNKDDSTDINQMEYRKPLHLLTRRECQVLQLLSEDESNRKVSKSLVISEKQVKKSESTILQKIILDDGPK